VSYQADVRDLKFQIFEWLPIADLLKHATFSDWDTESMTMALDEAVKLAQEELGPTNVEGDRVGARWEDGKVYVPPAFKAAYRKICDGGWIGCVNNPKFGGMGLPNVMGTAVNEVFSGANTSLSLTPVLSRGAGHLVETFGTEEMQTLFCEKLYTGAWAGTMCLTEPQAGSDVGCSKTRAVKMADGRYRIQGEKIFITSGEHDLTENIIHAVLARTPESPVGTAGLSLFIVPKIRVGPDGALGEPNDVHCSNIERKMGIHGSPTCSLVFGANDRCEGWLLGRENEGMKLMFQMMNAARIEVGLQGVAAAAAASQAALEYARTRLQGRHWTRLREHEAPQVPIVEHPDVRRMLLLASSYVQAMRALLLQTSFYLDRAAVSDGEERARWQSYAEVLTPVCKAWASDWGFRVTEWCLQVYGGYGYTSEYPAEQYLRDAKIASIYEGTNGIQALDLVLRKLPAGGGQPIRELLTMAGATAAKVAQDPQFGRGAALLAAGLKEIEEISRDLAGRKDAFMMMLLNSVPFLDMIGDVIGAHLLLDQALLARDKLNAMVREAGIDAKDRAAYRQLLGRSTDAAFYHNKVQAAIHFSIRVLPQVSARGVAIRAGETAPMEAVF